MHALSEIGVQVVAGLILTAFGFAFGWYAKSYSMKQKTGRDAFGSQAETGSAVTRDGVAVGSVTGSTVHIGDQYGQTEGEAERKERERLQKNKKVYREAVAILRNGQGFYTPPDTPSSLESLPQFLWHLHAPAWGVVVNRIARHNTTTSKWDPFIEPSLFNGEDDYAVAAAHQILTWYVWASKNNPYFDDIKGKFDIPDPVGVEELIT